MKKSYIIFVILGFLLLAAAAAFIVYVYPTAIKPGQDYKEAKALYDDGEYVLAALRFEILGKYENEAKESWLKAADKCFENGELPQARTFYLKGGADSSVYDKIDAAYYQRGVMAYADNERAEAENCFDCITYGSSYTQLLDPVRISCAQRFIAEEDFESAEKIFKLCGSSSHPEIVDIWLQHGASELEDYDFENALFCFAKAAAYSSDPNALTAVIDSAWSDAGERAMAADDYELAEKCFARMSGGADQIIAMRENYENALTALAEKRWFDAVALFEAASGYRDSLEQIDAILASFENSLAAAANGLYAALSPDGRVSLGGNWGNVSNPNWEGIKSIAVGGERFIIGLKEDGTVRFAGNNEFGISAVEEWTDIVAIACGRIHAVGLKSDGTVVVCGGDDYHQVSSIDDNWTDITAIAAFGSFTIGLKSDGTVITSGDNEFGQLNTEGLTDVVAIASGRNHGVYLHADGTVSAVGRSESGQLDVDGWTDIVAIYAGANHTIGVKADGTLVSCGSNANGERNLDGIDNVLAIACGSGFTIILQKDGTIIKLGI